MYQTELKIYVGDTGICRSDSNPAKDIWIFTVEHIVAKDCQAAAQFNMRANAIFTLCPEVVSIISPWK